MSRISLIACLLGVVIGYTVQSFLVGDTEQKLIAQKLELEIEATKTHMTTLLQLKGCHFNEAFYTLDRKIHLARKYIVNATPPEVLEEDFYRARLILDEYYSRFNLDPDCVDCVPRTPAPNISCVSV